MTRYTPVIKHSNGKSPFSIGNTSSKGSFSIAMSDYQRVFVKQITRCSLRYEQRCHRVPLSRDYQGGMSSFDGSHPRAQGQLYIRHSNLVVIATKYMKIHEHTAYPVRYLWQITLQISQVCKFSLYQIWIVWGLHDSTAWIHFFTKWWESPVVLMGVILNLQSSLSVFFPAKWIKWSEKSQSFWLQTSRFTKICRPWHA